MVIYPYKEYYSVIKISEVFYGDFGINESQNNCTE